MPVAVDIQPVEPAERLKRKECTDGAAIDRVAAPCLIIKGCGDHSATRVASRLVDLDLRSIMKQKDRNIIGERRAYVHE